MVGADGASPQPTVPSAASMRTMTFCAAVMVSAAIFIGALSGKATGMASTRRTISGAKSLGPKSARGGEAIRARTFTGHTLKRGSRKSRRLSPNKLKANTARLIIAPGNRIIHGAWR